MTQAIHPMFHTVADTNAVIDNIRNNVRNLENDIQVAARSAIYHANIHGNADVGIRLVDAMKDGKKKYKGFASLTVYLATYGKFQFEDGKLSFKKRDDVLTNPDQLNLVLNSNHWSDAVKEKDPESILDATAQFHALIKRVKKAFDAGKEISFGDDAESQYLKSLIIGADAVEVDQAAQ